MLLGIQAYYLNSKLTSKLGKFTINKLDMEELGQKVFFSINFNELLTQNVDPKSLKVTLNYKNQSKELANGNKLNIKNSQISEVDKNLNSLYENIFNINVGSKKHSNYKYYFNHEDMKNINILLKEKFQKKSHLPDCKLDDFEIIQLTNENILGKKISLFTKKKNKICALENFLLSQKQIKFLKNLMNSFIQLNLINSISLNDSKDNKSSYISDDKISLYLNDLENNLKINLENYIYEILNTENFMIHKIENSLCEIQKDFECLENAHFKLEINYKNINVFAKNSILQYCEQFKTYITKINSFNFFDKSSALNQNNLKVSDFAIMKSEGNSCIIAEFLLKILNSINLTKTTKIKINYDMSLMNLTDLIALKEINFDMILEKLKYNGIIKNDSKIDIVDRNKVKDEDNFKVNEQAGFGFLVLSFILIIFILLIYMGYLIIKNMLSTYFPYKKARTEEPYDDTTNLKVKTKGGKSKELDSIY